jgi:hypothetical protein
MYGLGIVTNQSSAFITNRGYVPSIHISWIWIIHINFMDMDHPYKFRGLGPMTPTCAKWPHVMSSHYVHYFSTWSITSQHGTRVSLLFVENTPQLYLRTTYGLDLGVPSFCILQAQVLENHPQYVGISLLREISPNNQTYSISPSIEQSLFIM